MKTAPAVDHRNTTRGHRTQPSGTSVVPRKRRGIRVNPFQVLGAMVVLALVLAGVLAPWVAPQDPFEQNARMRLQPPVWFAGGTSAHLLGTDQLGRDVLSRLIFGSRISLLVGFFAVMAGGTIGLMIGLLSGYLGGVYDSFFMSIADAQLAFPFILLAFAVMAAMGPGLTNVIIVLSFTSWVAFARLVRGVTLSVKKRDFIEAARAFGASPGRVMGRHILPQVFSPIIVLANLQLGFMIVAEAALSFLGIGINPPTPSWGNMITEGRNYIWNAPWLSVLPGTALTLTVLAFTFFGDWLRITLDPKYRGSQHALR